MLIKSLLLLALLPLYIVEWRDIYTNMRQADHHVTLIIIYIVFNVLTFVPHCTIIGFSGTIIVATVAALNLKKKGIK